MSFKSVKASNYTFSGLTRADEEEAKKREKRLNSLYGVQEESPSRSATADRATMYKEMRAKQDEVNNQRRGIQFTASKDEVPKFSSTGADTTPANYTNPDKYKTNADASALDRLATLGARQFAETKKVAETSKESIYRQKHPEYEDEQFDYKRRRKNMSEDEINLFDDYYYNSRYDENKRFADEASEKLKSQYGYSDDEIERYSIYLNREKTEDKMNRIISAAEEYADEHPILASASSVIPSVIGGAAGVAGKLANAEDATRLYESGGKATFDTNTMANAPSQYANAVRNRWMETHNYTTKGGFDYGDFLYSTALSGLDSLVAGTISGGVGATIGAEGGVFANIGKVGLSAGGMMLGLNSANEEINELQEKGASMSQALAGGLVAGTAEMFFEDYSLSELRKFKHINETEARSLKEWAKKLAASTFTNATEETFTEIANVVYDTLANGDISKYSEYVDSYMQSNPGASESEARNYAAKKLVQQIIEAGLGGALMGLGFGVGGMTLRNAQIAGNNVITDYKEGSRIVANQAQQDVVDSVQGEKAQSVAEAYKNSKSGGREETIKEKIKLGKMRRLSVENAIDNAVNESKVSETNIANEIATLKLNEGEKTNDKEIAQQARAIAEFINEGKYNKETAKLVNDDEQALKVFNSVESKSAASALLGTINAKSIASIGTEDYDTKSKFITSRDAYNITNPEVIVDGKTMRIDGQNTKKGHLTKFNGFVEDGKVKLANGKKVSVSELKFNDPESTGAKLITFASRMPASIQNLVVNNYNGADIDSYTTAVKKTMDFGRLGTSISALAKTDFFNEHNFLTKPFSEKLLIEGLRSKEFKAGVTDYSTNQTLRRKVGENTIDILNSIVKEQGFELFLFDSLGENSAYNGAFALGTNRIVLSLDAEGGLLLRTLTHEQTHFIAANNRKGYERLANRIKKAYEKKGRNFDEDKAEYIKRHNGVEDDRAEEEMICDALYNLYGDKDFIKGIIKSDEDIASSLKDNLDDYIDAYENALKELNLSGKNSEMTVLQDDIDTIKELRDIFNEELGYAMESLKTGRSIDEIRPDTEETSEGTMQDLPDFDVEFSTKDDYSEYDKPITQSDISVIRGIGRKSINEFTDEDIKKAQKWAYKFYKQMGTKSPFFRAWFGDWRAYDTKTKVEHVSVSNEKISPSDVSREGAINNDTGWKIKVNSDGIDETSHKRGKWSIDYHSLKSINSMLENAILLDTVVVDKPSKKMGKNATFVHHLYCPIMAEDNNGVAKLYVVEEINEAKKFYLNKIEMVSTDSTDSAKALSQNSSVDTINNISDLFDFVKNNNDKFESDSEQPTKFNPKSVNKELINSDGTPKVFYHGTTSFGFSEFNTEQIYLTSTLENASTYSGTSNITSNINRTNYVDIEKLNNEELAKFMSEYNTDGLSFEPTERNGKKGVKIKNGAFYDMYSAKEWAKRFVQARGNYAVYATAEKLLVIDNAEVNRRIPVPDSFPEIYKSLYKNGTQTNEIAKIAKELGYNGILFKHIGDKGPYGEIGGKADILCVFDSSQIKSATDNIGTFNKNEKDIRYSTKDTTDTADKLFTLNREISALRRQIDDIKQSDEYKAATTQGDDDLDTFVKRYGNYLNSSGFGNLSKQLASKEAEYKKLQEQADKEYADAASAKEAEAIAKSGGDRTEYFRKSAVKEFGYTPYFYDAGYLLPNGKMLNFSGEKGKHFGTRGEDHRGIGIIYENLQGSDAMTDFMNMGNIRIMAESSGIDISTATDITPQQYSMISKFIRDTAQKQGFFSVDFSDENGRSAGNYTYEDNINPTKIVNDIKYFFENGRTREQSVTSQFYYSTKDADYMKAVESGDIETAQRMVDEAAKAAGYVRESDYQGTSAFNGKAPSTNGYFETKAERVEAWRNGEFEDTQTLGDYITDGIDVSDLDYLINDSRAYRTADSMRKEAISNLRKAINNKSKTITMYRSVPKNIAEGFFRNGDWISPSRQYAVDNAELHGWGENYNIIENTVSVDDVWWDGNDICEWGFDNGNENLVYKNAKNNVKSADPITYDDKGNIIPLSQRFDSGNEDIRFSLKVEHTDGSEDIIRNPAEVSDDDVIKYLELARKQKINSKSYIPLGRYTPSVIVNSLYNSEVDIRPLPLVIQAGKAYKSMRKNPTKNKGKYNKGHDYKPEEIIEVLDAMNSPNNIILQANGRVAVFVNSNIRQSESLTVIEFDADVGDSLIDDDGITEFNTVVTIFDPDTIIGGEEYNYYQQLIDEGGQEIEIVEELDESDSIRKILPLSATSPSTTINPTTSPTQSQEKAVTSVTPTDAGVQFSTKVTDPKVLSFLNEQEKNRDVIVTYKTMQVIDGKLYSPMAAKVKGDDGKYHLTPPNTIGVWQQAVEDPSNIKIKANGKGYYTLNKGNGKSIDAAYNPYEHSSNLVLNDQFEEAYQRPNLVTVECIIPKSEMTSGYQAKYAKDPTGFLDWKAGTVAGQLTDNQRKVYLSRWLKPVRIVPDSEVASMYKEILSKDNISVPFNVVTPGLLAELEKQNVPIDYDGSPTYRSRNKNGNTSFSTKSDSSIDKYYDKLRTENKYLQNILTIMDERFESVRNTQNPQHTELKQADIDKIAKKILKGRDSKYDLEDFSNRLKSIYDYMLSGEFGDGFDTDAVMKALIDLAKDAIDKSEVVDRELYDATKWMRNDLRKNGVSVTRRRLKELNARFGGNVVKHFFGRIRINVVENSFDAVNLLDGGMFEKYRTGSETMQMLFDAAMDNTSADVDNIEDMFVILDKALELSKPVVYNRFDTGDYRTANSSENFIYRHRGEDSMYIEDAALLDAETMMSEYFNITRARTKAQQIANEKYDLQKQTKMLQDSLKAKFKKDTEDFKKDLKSWESSKIQEYKDEREAADRRRINNNDIDRCWNYVNSRLESQTPSKHITQENIDLARAFVDAVPSGNGKNKRFNSVALNKLLSELNNKIKNFDVEGVKSELAEEVQRFKDVIEQISGEQLSNGLYLPAADRRSLNTEQVGIISNISKMIRHIIDTDNKLFGDARKESLEQIKEKIVSDYASKPNSKYAEKTDVSDMMFSQDSFRTGLTKPEYLFKNCGSETLYGLYLDLRHGENDEGKILYNAKDFIVKTKEKYHYDKAWKMNTKPVQIKAINGKNISITREEAMYIYALSRRPQGMQHLIGLEDENIPGGGFVFKDAKTGKKSETGALTRIDINNIIAQLTPDQMHYVEDVTNYVSKTMGAERNKVSMALMGFEKYVEDNYVPIKTTKDTRQVSMNTPDRGTAVANQGASKTLNKHAKNAIDLDGFSNVINEHIYQTALYCGYAVPAENYNRVMNTKSSDESGKLLHAYVSEKVGLNVSNAMRQLFTDVNNGQIKSSDLELSARMMSKAKKAATMANISVIVQQPTAVFRAMLYIDPKYFATVANKEDLAEMYKYNGCALKKDIGYFDINVGKSVTDWLDDYDAGKGIRTGWSSDERRQYIKDNWQAKVDDLAGWGANKADEITWGAIWNACKKQVADKEGLSGSELIDRASELFQDTIIKTQVYDSVFTKPDWMRKKGGFAQAFTAFMSEPLTSLNMVSDAIHNREKTGNKFLVRAIAAYAASLVVNAACKSFVQVLRDDDDEKDFFVNYLTHVADNIVGDVFGMIPLLNTFIDLMQGWKDTKLDTQMLSSLVDMIKQTTKFIVSDDKNWKKEIFAILQFFSQLKGIPVYNVARDGYAAGEKVYRNITDGHWNVPFNAEDLANSLADNFDYLNLR